MISITLTNADPAIEDVFRALGKHTSDKYGHVDILRAALRWAELAANSTEYSNPNNPDALSTAFRLFGDPVAS